MTTNAAGPLAKAALDLVKTELLVNLRFMNVAFSRLELFPVQGATLATDAQHLRYDPAVIARMYANEPASLSRAYLHVVLHNVFLHPFCSEHANAACWDTACDIVVEKTISELNMPATRTPRAERQRASLAMLEGSVGLFTAEKVYRYLLDAQLSEEELAEVREPFYVDDHEPWHSMAAEEAAKRKQSEGAAEEKVAKQVGAAARAAGKAGTDMETPEDAREKGYNHKSHQSVSQENITQKEKPEELKQSFLNRFADTINMDRTKEQWKSAAYEMGVQLDAYAMMWGTEGKNLTMNLKTITRERQDYREFLRKFAQMGEQIRVNDDEFDYVYYCFGLDHFGNLPLIEPLEYVEEKRVRDFAIALDTSASTKDGLIRRFVEKTYSILSDETSFFADMNVLIIQCDAQVSDVVRITSRNDLHAYLDNFEVHGLGGTDFRPVFTYLEDAIEQGELSNLGGLVYLTDGQGRYPTRKPSFDTAFVFVDNTTQAAAPPVPAWAMKVVLDDTFVVDEGEDLA